MIRFFGLLCLCAVVFGEDCANFPPWREWTEDCLWLPINTMRQKIMDACDISVDIDESKIPAIPQIDQIPDSPCGFCSIKARCRTREPKDGCFPMEMERQTCSEHGDVCTFPKIELNNLGCAYSLIKPYFAQCSARPELPQWKIDGYKKMGDMWQDINCVDKDGQCKCCCHPYKPSADGSTCEEQTPAECEDFGDWNDWSECLWLPMENLQKTVTEHCAFSAWKPTEKQQAMLSKLKLPGGTDIPARCGYCSAQIKCRKRPFEDAMGKKQCFPLDAQKKACGASEECPTCADVCRLPKVLDSCNYSETLRKVLGPKAKAVLKKLPYSMTHSLTQMLGLMPHAECVEKDGECNCCCHPYKPSADGSTCELNEVCKTSEEHGVEIQWNASQDQAIDALFR